jgi:biopolymer transport protein ExbD
MQYWDVFHSDRLEAERSLTTSAVREALARGDLIEDDLVRPAGDTRWTRIGDSPEFGGLGTPNEAPSPEGPTTFEPPSFDEEEEQQTAESDHSRLEIVPETYTSIDREDLRRVESDSDDDFEFQAEPEQEPELSPPYRQPSSVTALPVLPDEETESPDLPEIVDLGDVAEFDAFDEHEYVVEEYDPQDEDDEAAEFTLSRNAAERVEELDLAAMVDVAFQLVLFFLVTAQVVLFKTLEVPRPNEDKPPEAAAQARTKSVDELEKDYILVEVDAAGAIKVDRQPVAANRPALVERLRKSRDDTARRAMLLSADFATRHENAVLVFDVANEIDLRIAIAQPSGKK